MIKKFFGIILITIGIIGLILPIMPGWLFIIPGIKLAFPNFTPLIIRYIKNKNKSFK